MIASVNLTEKGLLDIALGSGWIAQVAYRGKDLLGRGGIGLHLRHDSTDTWTFHSDRWIEPIEAKLAGGRWEVEETGPLRVRARCDTLLGNSRVLWTVSLYAGEPHIDLDLEINFAERFTLLQMPIRLSAPPDRGTDGIAGGAIDREPSPSEWPFLGWSRLRIGSTDIGLVTNDAYSHSVNRALWPPRPLRRPTRGCGE